MTSLRNPHVGRFFPLIFMVAVVVTECEQCAHAGPLTLLDRGLKTTADIDASTFYGHDQQSDDSTLQPKNVSSSLHVIRAPLQGYAASILNTLGDAAVAVDYFDHHDALQFGSFGATTTFIAVFQNVSGVPLSLNVSIFLPPSQMRVIDATGRDMHGVPNVNNPASPPHAEFSMNIGALPTHEPLSALHDLWSFQAGLTGFRESPQFTSFVGGTQFAVGGPIPTKSVAAYTSVNGPVVGAETTYDFPAFTAQLNLGVLSGDINSDDSALVFKYEIAAQVSGTGGVFDIGAHADVGDPFNFVGNPLSGMTFAFDPPVDLGPTAAVPEPGSALIFVCGLAAMFLTARRRRAG